MRIVSVPGRLVRDPVTRRVVDAAGITIDPTDVHWVRLIADGDVVEAPDELAPAAEAEPHGKAAPALAAPSEEHGA